MYCAVLSSTSQLASTSHTKDRTTGGARRSAWCFGALRRVWDAAAARLRLKRAIPSRAAAYATSSYSRRTSLRQACRWSPDFAPASHLCCCGTYITLLSRCRFAHPRLAGWPTCPFSSSVSFSKMIQPFSWHVLNHRIATRQLLHMLAAKHTR